MSGVMGGLMGMAFGLFLGSMDSGHSIGHCVLELMFVWCSVVVQMTNRASDRKKMCT